MRRHAKPAGLALVAALLLLGGILATRQPPARAPRSRPAKPPATAGRSAGGTDGGPRDGGPAAPTATAIVAHVTGLDGRAAAGVEVVLAGSGVWPPRKDRTGSDGTCTFEVPRGVYEVRARNDRAVAEPVEGVELGDERRNVYLALQPGRAIIGRVLDADTEAPIAGARVVVGEEALAVAPRIALSGADGGFTVEPLLERPHRVSVRADGYVSELGREVIAGDPVFEVRLHRGAVLSGVVVDERGFPVQGAQIEVLGITVTGGAVDVSAFSRAMEAADFDSLQGGTGVLRPAGELGVLTGPLPPIPGSGAAPEMAPSPFPSLGPVQGMMSGPRGEFVVTGVPPGRVVVAASHPRYARGESRTITVRPGATIGDIEVALAEGHRVSGRVVDPAGFPVAGATVELRVEQQSPRITVTQASGEFSFDPVDGVIVLRASASGFDPTVLSLPATEASELELKLTPAAPQVAGRVEDDRGYPVAQASVRLTPLQVAVEPVVVVSGDDGTFQVAIPAGVPARIEARHADHAPTIIASALPDPRQGFHVVLRRGGGLEGTVTAEDGGFAVSPFELSVTGEDGAPERLHVEDLDGLFRVANLVPGSYRVRITSTGYVPWEQVVEVPAPRTDEKITAPALRVELRQGNQAAGLVLDARRDPVPGARVRADRPALLLLGTGGRPPVTDEAGRFTVGDLPGGEVTLFAWHPALGTVQAVVDLSRGSIEDAELVFEGELSEDAPPAGPVRFGGLGAVLAGDRVAEVLEGSEAERAGLRAGDRITRVDGRALRGAALARALRGPAGTDVLLEVRRGAASWQTLVVRELLYR